MTPERRGTQGVKPHNWSLSSCLEASSIILTVRLTLSRVAVLLRLEAEIELLKLLEFVGIEESTCLRAWRNLHKIAGLQPSEFYTKVEKSHWNLKGQEFESCVYPSAETDEQMGLAMIQKKTRQPMDQSQTVPFQGGTQ